MDLQRTSLTDLAAACREETSKFQRGERSRNDYCREIVRRAVCERDHAAWDAVITQYRGIVVAWVRQHPASAAGREEDDYWVNRSFERFWMAVGPERFALFPDLAALLKYLKMCVNSVLLDDARARTAVQLEPLERAAGYAAGPSSDAEVVAVGHMAGRELWRTIAEEVPDEAERLVVYCSFALDLKPREIFERNPGRYPSVADVYRIKRNVLERLRRNPRIQQFAA
jgi:hypothetical protein